MARVAGWQGKYTVVDWDHDFFYLRPSRKSTDNDDLALEPLKVKLLENEMQEWAKDPKGMDKKYEPDIVRPGKFKVRSLIGR